MAAQVTNYQCPSCTGPLHFDGKSGKLECEYCGTAYDVAEIEALYAEKEEKANAAAEKEAARSSAENSWDAEGDMRTYTCPSCGAELICDSSTAATSCPYCGNPSVVPGQFDGTQRPDYVIPFKMTKDEAVAALKKHYKGKVFLPKAFSEHNHIEQIQGVYVPFWLFDGDADADMTFHATRSFTRTEGDYRVTTTEHFQVRRAGNVAFSRIPTDASSKMPDDHMDSIEPFDYDELKPFSTAYMPGYLADKYDVSEEECAPRAEERCRNSAREAMRNSVSGYASVIQETEYIDLHRQPAQYAMLPVWLLSTKWNGKNFLFAMNGQTGKMAGDLPVSWGKFWACFAAIAAPLATILALILYL